MTFPLKGRIILVTGAGRGVGRGHALTIASYGASVIVNDLGSELTGVGSDARPAEEVVALIRARGGQAVADFEDVSAWGGAQRAVEHGIAEFGRLDGVVNNAGIIRNTSFGGTSEEDFDRVMAVHVKATFACTQTAVRHWRARWESGEDVRASVVNTVSDAMFLGLVDPVYGAAKAAIATLTQVGSVDCAQYGIRMNAIAPNRAGTRMSKGSPIVSYADDSALPEAEDYKDESPLNPSNSSPIVAWLLSDRSLHVTGQVFRTLAGAVALGRGWTSGDFAWPDGGRMKYTFAEVERVINSKIFATTFERGRLEFAPNDPRVEVHP